MIETMQTHKEKKLVHLRVCVAAIQRDIKLAESDGSCIWENNETIENSRKECNPLDGGDGCLISDTTDVAALAQIDIASITPVGVPRVANDPVSASGVGVVANQLDAVVERSRVVSTVIRSLNHTSGVGLPNISSHANGDGTFLSKVGLEGIFVL